MFSLPRLDQSYGHIVGRFALRPLLGWSPPRHSLGYYKHFPMLVAPSFNSPSFIMVVPRKIVGAKFSTITLLVEAVLGRNFNCCYVILLVRHPLFRHVTLIRLVVFVVFKEIIVLDVKHRFDLG